MIDCGVCDQVDVRLINRTVELICAWQFVGYREEWWISKGRVESATGRARSHVDTESQSAMIISDDHSRVTLVVDRR